MAVPKCKVSKSRRDTRRSNNTKLVASGLTKCSNPECNEVVKPHHVCRVCGYYNGKKVLNVKQEA